MINWKCWGDCPENEINVLLLKRKMRSEAREIACRTLALLEANLSLSPGIPCVP